MVGKRLALFLDGTWNDVSSSTNVFRLHEALKPAGADGVIQMGCYDVGVGSVAGEKFRGSLGYGLSRNVLDAYSWLVSRHRDGDEIYIFGFSRGAYTARSLAGVIATCGLLKPGAEMSPAEIYARYRQRKAVRPLWAIEYEKGRNGAINADEDRLLDNARRVRIKMIGVWDTVGALGVPFGNFPGLSQRSFRFHNTNLSNIYDNAIHALAVDEHRKPFRPTLWTRFRPDGSAPGDYKPLPPGQKVEQRWFVGAHSNVGGGVAGSEMAQLPLDWMRAKAEATGLAFDPVALSGREHCGAISDSFREFMGGWYSLGGLRPRFHRTIGADERKVNKGYSQPINETIDATVFDRWRGDPSYRPPGLAQWAKRRNLALEAAAGDRDAATGAPL